MEKTYNFTKEQLINKCRAAVLLSTIRFLVLAQTKDEEKGNDLDEWANELFKLFSMEDKCN